jgi:hypothetical protein
MSKGSVSDLSLSWIKAILGPLFGDCQVYLFGSRAAGNYKDASDFDIGVLAARDISRELSLARERLEDSNIPFTVDLVDLSSTSEEFARRVREEGVLLWKN